MTITMDIIKEVLRICEHRGIELLAIKSGCKYHDVAIVTTWKSGTKYRVGYYTYQEEYAGKHVDLPSASTYTSDIKDAFSAFYMMG